MSDILDACTDLSQALKPDSNVTKLVQSIADDYALKVPMLVRQFTQLNGGKSPQQFADAIEGKQQFKRLEIDQANKAAVEQAHKRAKEFRIPYSLQSLIGKPFKYDSEDYVFVTLAGRGNNPKCYCVKVHGCKGWKIWGRSAIDQIWKQISKAPEQLIDDPEGD